DIEVAYVFGKSSQPKIMKNYKNFNFLENQRTFDAFLEDATLSDTEKHQILIQTQAELQKHAKALNKLTNNYNVGVSSRAIYVSGMLLAMQDVMDRPADPD